MKLRWSPCAFWMKVSEYKKLYTVTTTLCVPRFHAQTVRILHPIPSFCFYVQYRYGRKSVSSISSRDLFCSKHCIVKHSICRNVRDSSQELLRIQQAQFQCTAYRWERVSAIIHFSRIYKDVLINKFYIYRKHSSML